MIKTKNFKPYNRAKCTLQPSQGARAGVYIIYKSGKPVYIGYSASNLYKTMYRHFQKWPDDSQRRVTYSHLTDITCRVMFCPPSKAVILEQALILKYKPRDNEEKLNFYTSRQLVNIVQEMEDIIYTNIEDVPF